MHDITQLKGKETQPVPVQKRKNAAVEPIPHYNYFAHRMKRSVSRASIEARSGTAVSFSPREISSYSASSF